MSTASTLSPSTAASADKDGGGGDGGGYKMVTTPPATSWVDRFVGPLFVFIVIHYLVWFPVAVAGAFLAHWALGGGWTVPIVCAAAVAAYLPSCLDGSERRAGGRAWHWLRRLPMWRWGHQHVHLTMIRTAALPKQVVMGWHPHGIIILSRLAMYGGVFEELFPHLTDVRALGATPIFKWPGSREISLWLGAVDASPATAVKVLQSGRSIIVYPGGIKEIFRTDADSKETVLELLNAKGFVRLAIQFGVPLVPVAVFNERSAYTRIDLPAGIRNFALRVMRTPLLLFYGMWGTLMPRPINLGIVFGEPLPVPHIPDVGKGDPEIDRVHALYMAAFDKLWHDHKATFGYGADEKLVVV